MRGCHRSYIPHNRSIRFLIVFNHINKYFLSVNHISALVRYDLIVNLRLQSIDLGRIALTRDATRCSLRRRPLGRMILSRYADYLP